MISKEHKKHSHITKPSYGNFSRNEWAIIGGGKTVTENLAYAVFKNLSPFYKCAYAGGLTSRDQQDINGQTASGAVIVYENYENHYLVNYNKKLNRFGLRQLFTDADLVFVDGHFHRAKAQVIIIDSATKKQLQEDLSLLTDVQLIVLADHEDEPFDFIKQAIPGWQNLPVYCVSETDKISSFFKTQLTRSRPVLKGLVLAGGRSQRMGSDKGSISWHGKEQRYYMADLLRDFCEEVFISCRSGQKNDLDSNYKSIEDSFTELGPYGAILSAFREQPDCAWLVAACDMPLLDTATLQFLTEHRNQSTMATTFKSPGGFPEPLITIWEPKSYPILLSMLCQGYTCPRKALENNDVTILEPPNPDVLINVNTVEEKDRAEILLKVN